jgi:hypothetical protein
MLERRKTMKKILIVYTNGKKEESTEHVQGIRTTKNKVIIQYDNSEKTINKENIKNIKMEF